MSLEVIGRTKDLRTNTDIVYAQIEISDYLSLVGSDFDKFDLQRKREKHKAYIRLKKDIIAGALLPPITLSLKPDIAKKIKEEINELNNDQLADLLRESNQVYILDGLQRTYIINDIRQDYRNSTESNTFVQLSGEDIPPPFKEGQKLLLEFWVEDDIHNLIYRFIILNAGRKEMSLNHQLELLFMTIHERLEQEIEGLEIYNSKDATRRNKPKKYLFNHLVTSYHCFITGNYKIIKENLVAKRLSEEKIVYSNEEELSNKFDLFKQYIQIYTQIDAATYSSYNGSFQNWWSKENVMNSFFAALANYGNDNVNRQQRIQKALQVLLETLNPPPNFPITFPIHLNDEDLLSLNILGEVIGGIPASKKNIGIATKKLLFNSFKEFFRESGEKPLKEIWKDEVETI